MKQVQSRSRRARTAVHSLTLAAVVALGVTSCSDDGEPSGSGSSSESAGGSAAQAEKALNEGLDAQTNGDLTTAAEKYDEVLEIEPDNKFALYNLALIDEASSNYGLAEEKYRQALEADPEYQPALFNLAILVTSSDPEEAISLYQRAVEADPKDASAWLNLGLLLRASGDQAGGDRAVTKALKLNPELVDPAAESAGG